MQKKLKVVTICATFPSLIQPWLVSQLVQILQRGGETQVLARRSEAVYSQDIKHYGLDRKYRIIPEARGPLVKFLLMNFLLLSRMLKGLARYPKVLFSTDFSWKEKLYALCLLPDMGMDDVDIIHCHSEMAGNKLLPIVYALGVPFVVTFHGLPPQGVKPINDQQRRRYTAKAAAILVNTEFAKKQYASLGAPLEKIQVLPQGIFIKDFVSESQDKDDAPDSSVNILTVGRYHPDKGQSYAIEAVAELVHQGYDVNYFLVGNGPNRGELEAQASSLGIADRVRFHSNLSDAELRAIYRRAHIFILPSLDSQNGFHVETQGVVLQEAQASGLVVVATKTGGIPECIDDGVNGFLVRDRSSAELVEKLAFIIAQKDQWPEYRRAGLDWVKRRYDIDYIGGEIDKLYRRLI